MDDYVLVCIGMKMIFFNEIDMDVVGEVEFGEDVLLEIC